jgi:hypothetical protein
LGPEKSCRLKEVPDKTEISNWPLLTGGRYSQVVVNSSLNVLYYYIVGLGTGGVAAVVVGDLAVAVVLPHEVVIH